MNVIRWAALASRKLASLSRFAGPALGVGLCIAVLGLLGISYRSIDQWRRSSDMLTEQRAEVMLTLLATALNRDMRGAQVSVLLPLELGDIVQDPPHDLRDTFARAFARFPYAESFFVWTEDSDGASKFDLFNRADRPPPWDASPVRTGGYPAVLRRNPETCGPLLEALRERTRRGGRFIVFELVLNETPYQVVAKLFPGAHGVAPVGIVGFTVNLPWVRRRYFSELTGEVSRIGDTDGFISLAIEDEVGHTVVMTQPRATGAVVRQRTFLPLFFDPSMLSTLAPGTAARPWTAKVGATTERMLIAPLRGTYAMLAAAAVASVVGILLTAHAARARAELATMQSDFVYGVTHELKTPLSSIRLMAETLGQGRCTSIETISDYARLLSREAWRLTRLIDNLLTFARVTIEGGQHQFETIEIAELVEDVLNHFRPQLADKRFEVTVDVASELPRVRGDRAMLLQALDNVVDNAIKYSKDRRALTVRARAQDRTLRIEVTDRGLGIAPEEIVRVFEKFYRGRSVAVSGSGLGLAIVKRIVEDNGGVVEITSVLGEGTSVGLVLPVSG